jgi:DNA invertase Pin-like site-specific DNA recombinase
MIVVEMVTVDEHISRMMMMTKKKLVAIYCRCSTHEQKVDHQIEALVPYAELRGYQVFKQYIDEGESGSKANRPALDQMMTDARKRKFDVCLVWKFDRFARSVSQLTIALEEFRVLGIEFISFTENIDTSTPMGQAMFTIISAMAQLERDLTIERIKSGMDKAIKDGKKIGRPSANSLSEDKKEAILSDSRSGLSIRKIALKHQTNRSAVHRLIKNSQSEAINE